MVILIIVVAIALIGILEIVISRRGVQGISVEINPEVNAAEPGESFRISLKIINNSKAIYPFLRYTVLLPKTMEVISRANVTPNPPDSIAVTGSAVLLPKRTFCQEIEVSCAKRGYYRFGTVSIDVGDFLGMKEYRREYGMFRSVSVYPKKSENASIDETLGGVLGDYSVRRFIYEDPVLITGFREYTGREPMKSISWMQTARTGELMVKKYDYTSEPSVSVLLDTDGCDIQMVETSYSLARSVCEELENKNIEYDFFMNCDVGGIYCGQHYFAKGMGNRHLFGILYQLANATYTCSFSGQELMSRFNRSQSKSVGIILIRQGEISHADNDIY